MKTVGTRKIALLVAIGVLLVVYIFQLAFTGKNSVKTILLEETPDLITIQIGSNANIINIVNKNDSWFVGANEYEADKNIIESMVDSIKEIKLLGTVSTSQQNDYERYGLNSDEAIVVTASKNNSVLRTILVGKNATAGSQSYIRLDGEKHVYLAGDSFNSIFNVTVDSIRDKNIFRIDSSTIKSVKVLSKTENFSLVKDSVKKESNAEETESLESVQTNWILTAFSPLASTPNGMTVSVADSAKVSSWLNTIYALSAQSWLQDNATLPKENADLSVVIETDSDTYTINLYPTDIENQDEDCVASCSKTPYLFTVSSYTLQRFNKKSSDFMKS